MEWFSQHILLTALIVQALLVALSFALHFGAGWGWFWSTSPIWIGIILILILVGLFMWLLSTTTVG